MATERDFELLDDYLTNRLSETERSAFEKKLNADPDLRTEYNFQQNLVKGIQKARVAELKTMLNNTPVPPVSTGSTVIGKIVAGTLITGAAVTGLYLFFNDKEEAKPAQELVAPTQEQAIESQETPEGSNNPSAQQDEPQDQEESPSNSSSEEPVVEPQVEPKQPQLDVYDPQAEEDGSAGEKETTEGLTSAKEDSSPRNASSSIPVEVDPENKKYTFHYQFADGKLQLYGPFEKNLYEIMEFFNDDKRTVFLFYKDDYYLLKEDNDQVKQLTAIKDQALIKKLKEYRSN